MVASPPKPASTDCACFRSKSSRRSSPILVLVSVTSLTVVLGHRYYNEPKLAVDTPAPQTIRAPETANVVDPVATETARADARLQAHPVFTIDAVQTQQTKQQLAITLNQIAQLRQLTQPFPFVPVANLPAKTQQSLRQLPEGEWQLLFKTVFGPEGTSASANQALPMALQPLQQDLQRYRRQASTVAWFQLLDAVTQARQRYQDALATTNLQVPVKPATILQLTEPEWQILQTQLPQIAERMLAQGIPPGLPRSLQERGVKSNLNPLPVNTQPVGQTILLSILQPNLEIDQRNSRQQAEQAAQDIPPIVVPVKQGELIVREGERITPEAFLLLDHFNLTRRGINWWGLAATLGMVSGGIFLVRIVQLRFHLRLSTRDHLLLLLLSLSAPLMVWVIDINYTSLPAVGLLVGSFYGSPLGIALVGLLSLTMPVVLNASWLQLLPVATGSLVGALFARRLRSREELALLGGVIALVQGGTYLLVMGAAGMVWYGLLSAALWQSLIGLGWSIIALGISPYLEHLFDLVTPIRLAELANPNRAMLKRLSQEAPGTFQHTLFVATLAETGARALGCNVELVRAGTLYHDIGKMHDPLGFIENQMGGPNKHDELNDPWQSVEIIRKHVSEGILMARKCRLPTAIQAFIPEHQGTMLIAYFYYQAKQQQDKADRPLEEQDFRYAGPIPQSRETGVVMLADSCEAALRSLKDATPEAALNMVNKIFRARWEDQQLVDSHLTREDLKVLADVFVQVWLQFNHQRIHYPPAALSASKS